jgi:hypothetical protein
MGWVLTNGGRLQKNTYQCRVSAVAENSYDANGSVALEGLSFPNLGTFQAVVYMHSLGDNGARRVIQLI